MSEMKEAYQAYLISPCAVGDELPIAFEAGYLAGQASVEERVKELEEQIAGLTARDVFLTEKNAALKAQAGEPVAWQHRQRGLKEYEWQEWQTVGYKPQGPESQTFQMRPLFTHPTTERPYNPLNDYAVIPMNPTEPVKAQAGELKAAYYDGYTEREKEHREQAAEFICPSCNYGQRAGYFRCENCTHEYTIHTTEPIKEQAGEPDFYVRRRPSPGYEVVSSSDPMAQPAYLHPTTERRVPDAQEMRQMLAAMQAGEMTVSRGVELLDMWLAGNYTDDQLPSVAKSRTLDLDEMPWDRIEKLAGQVAALTQLYELSVDQYNERRVIPEDAELLAFAADEQFFLFCEELEVLDIMRTTLQKYLNAAPAKGEV